MKKIITLALIISILLTVLVASAACGIPGNKVAVISLSGPIQSERTGFLFGGSIISPQLVRSYLERANEDTMVKAIVLQIESPGGSVAACQEILNEIEQVDKPIVVSMGTVVASGGYYISAKADKIVALPGTLTGSIGVIAQVPNIKGLYDKLGIDMEVFKAGKYKDMYVGIRKLTAEERMLMQEITDQLYEQFIEAVAEGRGLSREEVVELATGQLYTGEQAKELGLVDELGGINAAIDLAASLAGIEEPKVEYYKREAPSLLDYIVGMNWQRLQSLVRVGVLGVEGIVLQEVLNNPYPQPEYR
ncbi:MAG TPA: signal peptide peptidase SppA [Dehalococcoidia bacterium]|nr:signal peptide peptidase SppA [Dehalococcoidia bacterium]